MKNETDLTKLTIEELKLRGDYHSCGYSVSLSTQYGTSSAKEGVYSANEKSRKLGADREITSAEALQLRASMLKGKSESKLEKA